MNEPIYVSVYKDTVLAHTMPELTDDKIAALCDYDNVVDLRVNKPDLTEYLSEFGISLDWCLSEHTADDNEYLIPWLVSNGRKFELAEYDRFNIAQEMKRFNLGVWDDEGW